MTDRDYRFAGNMTSAAMFGPLAVTVMLIVRFFLSPLAVALFCLVHFVVLYMLGSVMTQSIGGTLGFLFGIWVYSYILVGSFRSFMGPFESFENGILIWAVTTAGVTGRIYYFVQRCFVLIVFGGAAVVDLVNGNVSGNETLAVLMFLSSIQAAVFWVYHTRHPIGVLLDFWGHPRPAMMDGFTSADEALNHHREAVERRHGGHAEAPMDSAPSGAAPIEAGTMEEFADATPLTLVGRGGKTRKAMLAPDGRVLLETVTGPKVFMSEDRARAYIA